MLYASLDVLEFKHPGRKDDLISLCYLLCVMFNEGRFPNLNESEIGDYLNKGYTLQQAEYYHVLNAKTKSTIADIITIPSESYRAFVHSIFRLGFKDEPDYLHLISLLYQAINDLESSQDTSTEDFSFSSNPGLHSQRLPQIFRLKRIG